MLNGLGGGSAKAGGASPWDVSFLFQASSFFDASASWLFYTYKVATLSGWAMLLHGPGRHSQRLLAVGALASLSLGVALAVTVSLSLSYGSICLETHAVAMCQQREAWYATFHLAMVIISLASLVYFVSLLCVASRQVPSLRLSLITRPRFVSRPDSLHLAPCMPFRDSPRLCVAVAVCALAYHAGAEALTPGAGRRGGAGAARAATRRRDGALEHGARWRQAPPPCPRV